jgi:gas vesicle protein
VRILPNPGLENPTAPLAPEKQLSASENEKRLADLESAIKAQIEAVSKTLAGQVQESIQRTQQTVEAQRALLQKALDELHGRWQAERQALQQEYEAAGERWEDLWKKQEATLQQLAQEVADIRQTYLKVNPSTQAHATEPMARPLDTDPAPPTGRASLPVSPVPPQQETGSGAPTPIANLLKDPEPTRTLLSKIWNYLNQPALRVPPRR